MKSIPIIEEVADGGPRVTGTLEIRDYIAGVLAAGMLEGLAYELGGTIQIIDGEPTLVSIAIKGVPYKEGGLLW